MSPCYPTLSSRSGPVRSLTTFAPVPGSPTPRELAVADGKCTKMQNRTLEFMGNSAVGVRQ